MNSGSKWYELAAQQLVRYEALFKLLDEMQGVEDVAAISSCIATRWKYFANVGSWRLVVVKDTDFLVIDGFRGEAHLSDVQHLSSWDDYHRTLERPRLIRLNDPLVGPRPPEHLAGKLIHEIKVLPFLRSGSLIALLSVAARHEPFSELDNKFIRIFGRHFAERISDILFRRQATEALISKASRDALTGLYNRGAIIERLEGQLALARRTGHPLSVILADIDFFKVINDSHGHFAGDKVLCEVSNRLQIQTRDGDNFGRYGGEEFLFVLFPCDAEGVARAAERFRRAIADTPVSLGGEAPRKVDVTISLGTASTGGQADVSMEALLKQADNALYCSKANGRNRVTIG
jgi:diguanylate cyclase (GGDEF)-like protein